MAFAYLFLAQLDFLLLADGEAKPAGGAGAGGGGFTDFLFSNPLIPVVLMGLLFYTMFIRPDQKKQRDLKQMLAELKKNDAIVTIGGVCGTVVNVAPDSKFVTIRIDDTNNTRMRILRSSIASIDAGEVSGDKKDEQ